MTIQVLLTLGLIICAIYAYLQRRVSRFLNIVIYLCTVVGIYFVWFPEHATRVAHAVGVGRGADLVLYVWVIISIVIALNLHVKVAAEARKTTLLARHIALLQVLEQNDESNSNPFGDRSRSAGSG